MTIRSKLILLTLSLLLGAVSGQAIELTVDAELGPLVAGDHRLGTRVMAAPGPDGFDVPEPPHAPSDYLSLSFALPEPGDAFPNRWRSDYRSSGALNDGVEFWELHIESDSLGAAAMVSIDLIDGPPSEIQIYIIGPGGRLRTEFPASFAVPIESGHEVRWIEVEYSDPVVTESATWGDVKSLFR